MHPCACPPRRTGFKRVEGLFVLGIRVVIDDIMAGGVELAFGSVGAMSAREFFLHPGPEKVKLASKRKLIKGRQIRISNYTRQSRHIVDDRSDALAGLVSEHVKPPHNKLNSHSANSC
jgi:hypothetical protein